MATSAAVILVGGCGGGPNSTPYADVRDQATILNQLATAARARQRAGVNDVVAHLRRDDRALGIDATGGQLAFAADDLAIEARQPDGLAGLLHARSVELIAFAERPSPDFSMRGISDGSQFPTGAGQYGWRNQWRGKVGNCEVTVAAGALNDHASTGVIGIDSFAGCRSGTGKPLKVNDYQRIVLAPGDSGPLRFTGDHGTFLTLSGRRQLAFRLSLTTGRLTSS